MTSKNSNNHLNTLLQLRIWYCLTTILPILFQYCYKYCYSDSRNLWAVMKAGGLALLKSDSTHHFFRNACTKSVSLRFSQFSWLLTDFVCLYAYVFWLSLCKIVRSSVILLLPLFTGLQFKQCYGNALRIFTHISNNHRRQPRPRRSMRGRHYVATKREGPDGSMS